MLWDGYRSDSSKWRPILLRHMICSATSSRSHDRYRIQHIALQIMWRSKMGAILNYRTGSHPKSSSRNLALQELSYFTGLSWNCCQIVVAWLKYNNWWVHRRLFYWKMLTFDGVMEYFVWGIVGLPAVSDRPSLSCLSSLAFFFFISTPFPRHILPTFLTILPPGACAVWCSPSPPGAVQGTCGNVVPPHLIARSSEVWTQHCAVAFTRLIDEALTSKLPCAFPKYQWLDCAIRGINLWSFFEQKDDHFERKLRQGFASILFRKCFAIRWTTRGQREVKPAEVGSQFNSTLLSKGSCSAVRFCMMLLNSKCLTYYFLLCFTSTHIKSQTLTSNMKFFQNIYAMRSVTGHFRFHFYALLVVHVSDN